jgi:glutathione S-transferase
VAILDDAEAQLAKTPYLAGTEYSMADVIVTPVIFRTGLTVGLGEVASRMQDGSTGVRSVGWQLHEEDLPRFTCTEG